MSKNIKKNIMILSMDVLYGFVIAVMVTTAVFLQFATTIVADIDFEYYIEVKYLYAIIAAGGLLTIARTTTIMGETKRQVLPTTKFGKPEDAIGIMVVMSCAAIAYTAIVRIHTLEFFRESYKLEDIGESISLYFFKTGVLTAILTLLFAALRGLAYKYYVIQRESKIDEYVDRLIKAAEETEGPEESEESGQYITLTRSS